MLAALMTFAAGSPAPRPSVIVCGAPPLARTSVGPAERAAEGPGVAALQPGQRVGDVVDRVVAGIGRTSSVSYGDVSQRQSSPASERARAGSLDRQRFPGLNSSKLL